MRVLVISAATAVLAACTPARVDWPNDYAGDGEDAFLVDDDFTCIGGEEWVEVDGTRFTNVNGHLAEAEAVATAPEGASFPVGTVISLFPDEVMVKRGAGFEPDTKDWEFLVLHVASGSTVITARGTTEMANPGGTCMSCHVAAERFDYVCFTNDTCKPLPFFIDTNVDPATEDARCDR